MNTWTPQTGVKYSGLSTSPKKKKKKEKKKKEMHSGGMWKKDREEKIAEVRDTKRKKKKKFSRKKAAHTAGSTIPTGTGVTTTPRGNREKRLTRSKVTAPSCHKLPTASTRKQQARESRKRGSGTASGTATDPSQ